MLVSVTMKGGMRSHATAAPFAAPAIKPVISITPAPASAAPLPPPELAEVIVNAPVTLASAITLVADRSMPPVSTTIVCPTATISSGIMLPMTLTRFSGEAKSGALTQANAAHEPHNSSTKYSDLINLSSRLRPPHSA